MKFQVSRLYAGLVALLFASAGMAATVTITPSTLTPNVGDTFTMTITADIGNTFAATMALAFDATKVEYLSGLPLSPWTVFTKNSPTTANPTVFDVETPSATAASPGTYDVAVLTFQALAAGAANILINDDGGNVTGWFDADTADPISVTYTQASVMVTGTEPNIVVTDSVPPTDDLQVPFGQVTEGSTSGTLTVTVTNSGNLDDLVLGTVALANPLAAPFTIVSDTCSGQAVHFSSSCTIGLEFSPVASGPFQDSFDIPSNDPDTASVTVQVSGTGIALPVPNIVVTDSIAPTNDLQMALGSFYNGTFGYQVITLTNSGTASLTVGQVATLNPLVAPFSVSADTCSGQVLAPSATCTVQVRFEPTAVGNFTDTLDIPSDDPDSPSITFSVSGIGVPVPVPDIAVTDSVSPSDDLMVDFGDVTLPNAATQTVTVTNAGTASLVMGTVAAANPLVAPFSITANTCSGQTLAPAATCAITVRFAPDAIQPYNESFDIPSNDPDSPSVTITLAGSGMPARSSSGSSAADPATLLVLGLAGLLAGRRRRVTMVD
ncbi:MAG: choice-of-anchor D domain-containing protein [Gammaproteobacteria bacterium]